MDVILDLLNLEKHILDPNSNIKCCKIILEKISQEMMHF